MWKSPEWSNGWRVVLAGSIGMGVGVGLYVMLAGLFIRPLEAEFGWSRGDIAAAGMFGVVASFILPMIGVLADRHGVKLIAAVGMVLLSVGYVLLSQISADIRSYYSVIIFFVLAGLLTGPLLFTKAVNSWFIDHRGIALGITLSGVTVTTMLALPLTAVVIDAWGWRVAFLLLALLPLGLGLPVVALWLKEKNQPKVVMQNDSSLSAKFAGSSESIEGIGDSEGRDFSLREVVKDLRFLLLAVGLLIANLAVGGIISQLQPILFELGFSTAKASLLGSIFAGAIAVGRLGCGWLLDRFWPPGVASACLLLPIIGLAILLTISLPVFYLAVIAVFFLGLAQGAEVDFVAFLVPRYFGMKHYGAIFGCLAMLISISLALGALLYGYTFDSYNNYRFALMVSVYCYAFGSICILMSGLVKQTDKYRQRGAVSTL